MSKKCVAGRGGRRRAWLSGASAVALAAPLLVAAQAGAVEFNAGELKGSFDTTLSLGALFRIQDQDPDLIGRANGGRGFSTNVDDGNRNYDRGLASLLGRATHELSLDYQNYGAFVRATYFYDWINAQRSGTRGARTNAVPLTEDAVEAVGRDFDLLDAYVFGDWDVAGRPVTARIGNQVINWGESTFIPGGLSGINPVDVAALRAPGSEIRDALRPVPMVSGSVGLTDDLTVEGFYQFAWQKTELEPRGTLFSTNDFATPGGQFVNLGFGAFENSPAGGPIGVRVPRGADREADDQGQFGVALRYFAEGLNETEFGAYFVNHHSRVPVISARTGSPAGLVAGNYAATSRYVVEYPEDIKVYGASFNTSVGGVTLQGEYTLRQDQPLQVDDVELLQAAVAPAAIAGTCAATPAACAATIAAFNTNQIIRQLGGINLGNLNGFFGRDIEGFRRHDVSQLQLAATKVFAPALGADQWLLVGEAGTVYVHGMPDGSVLRYDGSGTFRGGNRSLAGAEGTQADGFADPFSWGYRLRARFDYLNAVGPVNLYPIVSWSHDVAGTTPLPLGTFIEDRKAISVGLQATYLDAWTGEVALTSFFGGEDFNLLHDRDFLSFNLKYSF